MSTGENCAFEIRTGRHEIILSFKVRRDTKIKSRKIDITKTNLTVKVIIINKIIVWFKYDGKHKYRVTSNVYPTKTDLTEKVVLINEIVLSFNV